MTDSQGRWQYRVLRYGMLLKGREEHDAPLWSQFEKRLNELSAEGWEVMPVDLWGKPDPVALALLLRRWIPGDASE